mgnify:CR=1 FL=1
MKKIIKEGAELERFTLPRAEAIKLMEERERNLHFYTLHLCAFFAHQQFFAKLHI